MKFISAIFFATVASALVLRRPQTPVNSMINIQDAVVLVNSQLRIAEQIGKDSYPAVLNECLANVDQTIKNTTSYLGTMTGLSKSEENAVFPWITRLGFFGRHLCEALNERILAIYKSDCCNSVQLHLGTIRDDFMGLGQVLSDKVSKDQRPRVEAYTREVAEILQIHMAGFAPDTCKASAMQVVTPTPVTHDSDMASHSFGAWVDGTPVPLDFFP
ncbi:hypothetical protein DCS_06422 [Drechmeria coniospora]|uniref:Uncharacterized protein n=1 Tax=Drechmeria coniospora TaxID=98403 RepID=A0A151GBN9_DRECN|nr:hypothetical protein DCS_06422 [Drechmeria coniospora]KYK54464.1 hypothetical protein DCS_06422 [Drechmeria coniospora]ODA77634.1 hypothetical protein RJ55_07263 [Drechmeria coniospora]